VYSFTAEWTVVIDDGRNPFLPHHELGILLISIFTLNPLGVYRLPTDSFHERALVSET